MYNITGEQLMKEEKEIQGTAIIRVNNLPGRYLHFEGANRRR